MRNTLCAMFRNTVALHGDRPAFKTKVGDLFQAVTYKEVEERAVCLATAIARRGVEYQDHVGLIADNRLEWILSDLAIILAGACDVPRGCDTTLPELTYILNHSDATAVFVENGTQLDKVLSIPDLAQRLRFIAVMDPAFPGSTHPKVVTVASLLEEGRRLVAGGDRIIQERSERVGPDDIATIIYTSGTTGEPKGVVLLHRNIMHNVRIVPDLIGITKEDRFLSILPPWHIFERTVEYVVISTGASTAYTSIRTFAQDMTIEKPTYLASVPRIWEGIYFKVMAQVAKEKPVRQRMFDFLMTSSRDWVRASRVLSDEDAVFTPQSPWERFSAKVRALWTMLALFLPYRVAQGKFAAIRQKTGGCLKAAVSGGGALPPYVDDFFAAVGITLLEGYGLTETSPVVAARFPGRRVMGTVGPPIAETEVKVVDENNQALGPGGKGIIKVRGELVMKGYYKREDLTSQVLDADGWLDTGDIGIFTARGELAIRGRAKETIVLLGGENVEPNPIEDKITESRFISQAMVVGQDRKALGALLVPDAEAVREHFRSHGQPLPDGNLAAMPQVAELLKAEVARLITAQAGFRPFEKIGRVRIMEQEFKVGDEMTQTMKKRRNYIAEKYAREIEALYT
jgi:long-chain acyl-CoA synthetase